jgi:hypothetical protein
MLVMGAFPLFAEGKFTHKLAGAWDVTFGAKLNLRRSSD